MNERHKIHIVPFSHLDLFWAGSREECLSRGVHIIKTALDLLEKYPEYHFMIESTSFLEHYLDSFPEEKERVAGFIEAERLEIIPMRGIIYTQLPSGETLVRNLLHGREYCLRKFGVSGSVASLSDIPGVTPQMPQIAARSGMTALFLSHGCPPHTDHIVYSALDGTAIQAYAPIHYAKCRRMLANAENYDEMLQKEEAFASYFGAVDYDQLCQWGVDLCVISENAVKNVLRWNQDGHFPLEFSTMSKFFAKNAPENQMRISGEIPSLWPNVESSWPDLWPLDLPCENAMFTAEFFMALTSTFEPAPMMRKAWDWLIDGMDHNQNGIGGDYADNDKRSLKLAAKAVAEQVTKQLAWKTAARVKAPRPMAFPIVIFNPLSWKRSELLRARTALYGDTDAKYRAMDENKYRLIDKTGAEIPFRTVMHRQRVADTVEVEFCAEEIPAFGAKTYYLEAVEPSTLNSPFTVDDGDERDKAAPHLYAGESSVENALIRLEVDRITGELSLFDKRRQRYIFRRAGILALEEKRGDYICNMDLTGRVVPAVVEKLELVDHAPAAYRIRLTGTVYGQRFTQEATLGSDSSTVDIENTIHWREGCYARFEQAFPFDSEQEAQIRYGVPFGSVVYPETIYSNGLSFEDLVTPERGDNPDDAITRIRLVSKWISMRDSTCAVTIGTDHRMWELDGNTIRNCMLRSIGTMSGGYLINDDKTLEGLKRPPAGDYTFRYRISLEDGDTVPDGRCGWELNAPLYPVGVGMSAADGSPGLELPIMPDCTGKSVLICNAKPGLANPADTVFRCFETSGQSETLTLPVIPGQQWWESNLMEEEAVPCDTSTIAFKPYEIKTLISREA
jgi:alpha-mannosidase